MANSAPNFTRLDSTRPEFMALIAAMLGSCRMIGNDDYEAVL
jgi:hypothetical protein